MAELAGLIDHIVGIDRLPPAIALAATRFPTGADHYSIVYEDRGSAYMNTALRRSINGSQQILCEGLGEPANDWFFRYLFETEGIEGLSRLDQALPLIRHNYTNSVNAFGLAYNRDFPDLLQDSRDWLFAPE